jgi:hypothetical protein
MHGCEQLADGFSKQNLLHFVSLNVVWKIHIVRHSGCCQCCWHVCAAMKQCLGYSGLYVCCHEWKYVLGLRYSVMLRGYTGVGVFSNWSTGTCLCMCSTNLASNTQAHFWKRTCSTEKIRGKTKSFGFLCLKLFFVVEHNRTVVHGYGQSDERIFKAKPFTFHRFESVREILNLFNTVNTVSAVGMCALRCNIEQLTVVFRFDIMSDTLFEQKIDLR